MAEKFPECPELRTELESPPPAGQLHVFIHAGNSTSVRCVALAPVAAGGKA
jgi:hypothetical protein